jgi:chemosensory pili system protein ChpA (sensor histidine kinase/response regulator)
MPLAVPDETHASLQLVVREIAEELNEARAALEVFAENTGDRGALHRFVAHVHLARGALRMTEVYGGALLGEEMEHVARYVDGHSRDGKIDMDALDALMRSMEQLPAYVDRVASGGRDVPLALLPLLNDLRAVRGSALLSEGTLLLLNLRSDEQARPAGDEATRQSAVELARHLRQRFQLALLGWIRNEHVEQNLAALADIAEQFESSAATQPLFQLWWVVGSVLEALQQGGIDGSVSVKRLLGQVDRELRRLQEQGEPRYAESPPVELLNNLLFYVGRATVAGPRIAGVRESFRLDEVLGVDDQVAEARETLSAPSVRLMKTVAAAIREDLTRVKDVLDIFVRKGANQVDELVPQLEMLRKISDTLGVLGLGALRDRVQGEIESLRGIVDRHQPPDDAALLGIASALIEVEDSLDSQLVRLILPEAMPADGSPAEPTDQEFRHVQDAVLRECIVNMARIKEGITQALVAPAEAQGLDQVPQLVRGITAGLLMLGKQRSVEVMERVGRALAGIVRPEPGAFAPPRLDRLADAIVAVEYYMEMLQAGRTDQWHMLENAESCLAEIEQASPNVIVLRPSRVPEGEALPADAQSVTAGQSQAEAAPAPVAAQYTAPQTAPAAAAPPVEPTAVDSEFRLLFVEEARENIAQLQALFPQWESNPVDAQALRDVRRVFHTLKGSGRMVGARRVSEFSWSIESVLNRVISQTLARSPEVVEVVRDAVAAMPQLVDELEYGGETSLDVNAIASRADALSGREAAAVPAATPAPVESTPEPPQAAVAAYDAPLAPQQQPGRDPVLHDIFRKETAGHVAVVRDFIARCREAVAPYPVTEALHRAAHTLSGIAKTAGVRQGIKVAEPMEHYIRKLHDNGHGLPEEALLLLRDTVHSLENVVEHVDEDTGYFPDHGRLIAGWHALERSLDAELARLAEAGERTVADAWRPEETPPDASPAVAHQAVPDAASEAMFQEVFQDASAGVAEVAPGIVAATPAGGAAVKLQSEAELTEPHLVMPELPPDMPPPTEVRLVQALPLEPEPVGPDVDDGSGEPGFDADIAAIFSEEATELLEQAESSLGSWARDRADRVRITELKRVLHTLKGGARMAGIRAMGDLSHEMESFLGSLEAGAVASDSAAVAVLQASLDELHRMRETAIAGQHIVPARELIQRVRAVAAASVTATSVTAAAPVESAESAEPVDAVEAVEVWPVEASAADTVEALIEPSPEPVSATYEPMEPVEQPHVAFEYEEPVPAIGAGLPMTGTEAPSWPQQTFEAAAAATPFVLPGREPVTPAERHELARVSADLLDELLNSAGEVSIYRARVEQQMTSTEFNLAELGRTVTRLREQLRKLELETEAQILFRHQGEAQGREDFDPLELDRYSTIQQLSRALAESVSDVASIESLLESVNREGQNLLQQQGRVVAELQNGLMRTRMVPFQRHGQRLTRLTRQAAQEAGKKVELVIEGGDGEIDRQVLERMLPPFEHMLRNAVVHGIELPEDRLVRGKAETGRIAVRLQREGAEVVITVEDDGAGLDIAAIRAKARHMGLLRPEQELTDEEALQLVLEPGFSTADRLTQQAGRGIGMDVVATEVKRLGGGLYIESTPGQGARFTIRLPFTLAITQALVVRVHDEFYALPVATVEGVSRLPSSEVRAHLEEEHPTFEYGGHVYRFQHLGAFLGSGPSTLPETETALPVILVRAGEHSTALVTDELMGSREIVVKSVGPQVASVRGVSGATILGDGRIVIILDMGALVRSEWRSRTADVSVRQTRDERIFVMVVDDSITVRRVTQRLLERNGMRVLTAKDGVDAMALLQEHTPDVILLDIEMPRMDGYEVAAHVRNDPRLADIPLIMITSRVGDKHRARAIELGVDDYLGKPYQESQLLDAIEPLVLARRRQTQ